MRLTIGALVDLGGCEIGDTRFFTEKLVKEAKVRNMAQRETLP